jgi:hypothetical protein
LVRAVRESEARNRDVRIGKRPKHEHWAAAGQIDFIADAAIEAFFKRSPLWF